MTQAIANHDTLNYSKLTGKKSLSAKTDNNSPKICTNNNLKNKFNNILDKTVEKKDCTLNDIKNANTEENSTSIIDEFRELLEKAAQEVTTEQSLDLTLEQDIAKIISQLQSVVNDNQINIENNANILTQEAQSKMIATKSVATAKTAESNSDALSDDTTLSLNEEMLNELNIESINAESNPSNNDAMTQQESPEEFGVKIMLNQNIENFEVNLNKSVNNSPVKMTDVSPEKIIEQLTKHFDSLKSASKVNIVLNPEILGKVNLQIVNSKDGLSALFTVTTDEARDLLMKGLDGLKEALLTQGVDVDNLSVKVFETEEAYTPDWTEQQESESGNKEQQKQKQKQEEEKGLFEKTIAKNIKNENGNV